jgi:hypothetical protein
MKDKDSQLIFEAYITEAFKPAKGSALDGMLDPEDLGLDADLNPLKDDDPRGDYHDDVAFKSHAYDEFSLGYDLDAIQELVDFLKSEFEEGTHYKLQLGYGDDLPNTVYIHKKFSAPEELERKLAELLDGAREEEEDFADKDDPNPWA